MVVTWGNPTDPKYNANLYPTFDGVALVSISASSSASGSLLSGGQWVLTAAHVGVDINSASRVVFSSGGQTYAYAIDRVVINPGYTGPNNDSDVALLHLSTVVIPTIPRYELYRGTYELGQTFVVSGFGLTGNGITGQIPGTAASLKLFGYNTWDVVTTQHFTYGRVSVPGNSLIYDFDDGSTFNDILGAAGVPGLGLGASEVSQAQGDSGGPEFLSPFGVFQVAGITNATPFAGSSGTLSSFGSVQYDARVSVYAPWIDAITGAPSVITGTAANEFHYANSLNESINGGGGRDTVFEPAKAADAIGTHNADGSWTVKTPTSGTDTLINIERVRFYDGVVLLDGGNNGPAAYRLYQAAFARQPDEAGLRVQIGALDSGTSLINLANAFIGSAEFKTKYGASPADGTFVDLLYQNVLGRLPDAGGRAVQVDALNHGLARAQLLTNFSESAENLALTAPVTTVGLFTQSYDTNYG